MKRFQLLGALIAIVSAAFMGGGVVIGGVYGLAIGFAIFVAARLAALLTKD